MRRGSGNGALVQLDMGVAPGEAGSRGAARVDAAMAVLEYDHARSWFAENSSTLASPLAVEVWLFDEALERVLLVRHRWRLWVPPGGKVERGETPRTAAQREVFEETGLRPVLRAEPAAVAVRSYHPDWPATLGLSYAAVGEPASALRAEAGQEVAWTPLARTWESAFPDDIDRMRTYVNWLRSRS